MYHTTTFTQTSHKKQVSIPSGLLTNASRIYRMSSDPLNKNKSPWTHPEAY